MSQKFVMLFLVSTPQIVSLEIAAKILIGEDHVEDLDKSKYKSKCPNRPLGGLGSTQEQQSFAYHLIRCRADFWVYVYIRSLPIYLTATHLTSTPPLVLLLMVEFSKTYSLLTV